VVVVKPTPFEYHQLTSVTEVIDLLGEYQHDAELMAGNQSLDIVMSNRFTTSGHIIDINRIEKFKYIYFPIRWSRSGR
jgi:carbon-monoxide dehydrogenase medium subunit